MLEHARQAVLAAAERIAWLPPLLARIALGGTFVGTGWGKLHDLGKVVGFFVELGLPAPSFLARLVGATEFTCGLLLLAGLLTRVAAVPLIGVMAVAIAAARMSDVHGVSDFLGLEELTYSIVLLWLVAAGPGRVSLDALLARWLERKGQREEEVRP